MVRGWFTWNFGSYVLYMRDVVGSCRTCIFSSREWVTASVHAVTGLDLQGGRRRLERLESL